MDRTRLSLLTRVTAEFTVIVLGVLVALAADRWNQGRVEDAASAEYVHRLLEELVSDSARLAAQLPVAEAGAEAALALLEVVRGSEPDTTAWQLHYTCMSGDFTQVGGATYNELQSSGNLRLLPPDLRELLFGYYAFAQGMVKRIDENRGLFRHPMVYASGMSGAFLPTSPGSRAEFTERLRAFPGIEEAVMGCYTYQRAGVRGLLGQWIGRLAPVIDSIRAVDSARRP